MLERDVVDMANYFGRFAPEWHIKPYGKKI
jgi:hypothetical protein